MENYYKKSFLGDIFNVSDIEFIQGVSRLYIGVYSLIFIIFLVVSRHFYWTFLSTIFSLLTGATLFALLFIVAFAFALDFVVEFPKEFRGYKETNEYKISISVGVILLVVAMFIQYYLDAVTDHYEFQCGTYLVDINNNIFHILGCDCETLMEASNIVEMRGYEIEMKTTCTLCDECECIVEDAIDAYESEMYYRR